VPPAAPPPPKSPGSPLPKILLLFSILVCLAVAGLFGYKYLQQYMNSSKEVTLVYWGLWENDSVIRPIISQFEAANPKIKVQYSKQSQQQYRERLQSAIERGDGPDIFRFHNTWVSMLHADLAAVPAGVMSASEFSQTFYPVMKSDLVAGQTIYGIPLMIDGLGLYYNEDLFAAAGVTGPPTTWEDLLAIVPKISKSRGNTFDVSAIALGTINNIENYSDILANMFMQNGVSLVSPKGAEAEQTLTFYRRFASPADPVYTWNDTMDNSIYAFATGKVAMILAPSWRAFDIKEINPAIRFKIAPVPQLPGNTVTWASYWVEGVSAKSNYQEQAWKFLKFLTSKESATQLFTEESKVRLFGEPYARMDMASTLTSHPLAGAYIQQAKDAKSFPLASRTFDNGINDKMIVYLKDTVNAISGGSSPAEELIRLSNGFQQILTTYGLISSSAPKTN
jgi:multiple sugar transport system substrate-binding protein